MKRSIFILLILVTLVATLTSCVPAAAPAAQPAAQPAAAEAPKWCSNLRIVFFPGGPQGGVFANNVYNGAKQAQADLGPKVDYVFSDWDPQKMIQQFREAAATKPDGIAVMGHPGDESFDPLIEDAVKNGILVTSQNTTLPNMETKYAGQGFGYPGTHFPDRSFPVLGVLLDDVGPAAGTDIRSATVDGAEQIRFALHQAHGKSVDREDVQGLQSHGVIAAKQVLVAGEVGEEEAAFRVHPGEGAGKGAPARTREKPRQTRSPARLPGAAWSLPGSCA